MSSRGISTILLCMCLCALREYYDCARELFSAPSISARLLSTLLLQFWSPCVSIVQLYMCNTIYYIVNAVGDVCEFKSQRKRKKKMRKEGRKEGKTKRMKSAAYKYSIILINKYIYVTL